MHGPRISCLDEPVNLCQWLCVLWEGRHRTDDSAGSSDFCLRGSAALPTGPTIYCSVMPGTQVSLICNQDLQVLKERRWLLFLCWPNGCQTLVPAPAYLEMRTVCGEPGETVPWSSAVSWWSPCGWHSVSGLLSLCANSE